MECLKGLSLHPASLDKFYPIFNFPFLGKMVERMVTWQLQRTLDGADYLILIQSRFRPGFKTEMALIVLMDDLWQEQDGGSTSNLALLVTSAASPIPSIIVSVLVEGERFSSQLLLQGVPQGSVLSLLLFNIYMRPLDEVIHLFGVK